MKVDGYIFRPCDRVIVETEDDHNVTDIGGYETS
jgi:hypothetical protein